MLSEVISGLQKTPKQIAPKYFYDEKGSLLFEEITELPEYYLTRTEMGILESCSEELADIVGQDCCLIEYGSGSSKKVRLLIDALAPSYYVPVDISKEHLKQAAEAIYRDYESLAVYPICVDYSVPFALPNEIDGANRCGFFPGSSIGNFEREGAVDFLKSVHGEIGSGGYVILGIDTRKDPKLLESAYNDSKGITAEFNLNALRNLNGLIDSDFEAENFDHLAFYDQELGRIEMHLISNCKQTVTLSGHEFHIEMGENLHTENSYKYSGKEIDALARMSNMKCVKSWEDSEEMFAVVLLQAN